MWFFPTLILLTPLLSRACMVGMSSKPRPAGPSNEQICIDEYEECVALCESGTDTETGTDTGDETDTDTGETDTGGESECVMACDEALLDCFEFGSSTPPPEMPPELYEPEPPTCDPQTGYCGYAEDYDYGEPVEQYPSDDSYDWSCDSSDDDYSSDDSSGFFSCDYSDDDYSSDDYSDDGGGWDCSSDNYDEGDSDSDGDDEGEWGEDWGERSPAGGDGIEAPSDLPLE